MPKGMGERQEVATAAVKLREMIRELEVGVANLKGRGLGVLDLLRLRDQAEAEMARLAPDMDLRPERTRLETVDGILTRKTTQVIRELRSIGGLAGARRQENPPKEHWWWYLDVFLAERQRKFAIRAVLTVVGVLVLLVIANFVMERFFGLDPVQKKAHAHVSSGEHYMLQGEYDKAISEYESAIATLPSLGEAHVALGVLYELKGETEKAKAAFAAGEAAYQDRTEYLLTLSRAYQSVQNLDKAFEIVQEAIKLSPDSPQAYLVRGGIYEMKDDLAPALTDYEKAAELAQAQGQDTVYVLAKTRFATLLQRAAAQVPVPK